METNLWDSQEPFRKTRQHFSHRSLFQKQIVKKSFFVKQHVKHQLNLQDEQRLSEFSVITITESKYLEIKGPQGFVVLRDLFCYSLFTNE